MADKCLKERLCEMLKGEFRIESEYELDAAIKNLPALDISIFIKNTRGVKGCKDGKLEHSSYVPSLQ